jgi:hypothetical protein
MEYLMTYGWSILIIAVVLGALFQLGVFSGIGTPRAQPGNCQIVKVGSGITQTISLAGECRGQEPEYVATIKSAPAVSATIFMAPSALTRSLWFYYTGNPSGSWLAMLGSDNATSNTFGVCAYRIAITPSNVLFFDAGAHTDYQTSAYVSPNKWHNVIITVQDSGSRANFVAYLDGEVVDSGTAGTPISAISGLYIGGDGNCDGDNFLNAGGQVANLQIYNTSLSSAEANALYLEGIGGAPIKPQNIILWWPLNGNAQDYSGNNNNGQATGITYSSSWTSGYTPP